MTPIFSGVGTAIGHEPDEPQSVPVVPAAALELGQLAPSVYPSRAKRGLMVYGVRILWFDGGNLRTGSSNHGETFRD